MVVLGIDRSHWNAMPNFTTLKANGIGFVINKGTEGSGLTDTTLAACRSGAKAAGLIFGSYHFATWGNVTSEVNWFLAQVKPQPGELVALDAEAAIPAGVDVVAWCDQFSRAVKARVGVAPLIYMNQSWLAGHNWAPVLADGDGLWLAKYDNATTGGALGPWPVMSMKQFTDAASIPGQVGTVDEDAFEGSLATLLKYAIPAPAPAPTPTPVPAPIPAPAPTPTPSEDFVGLQFNSLDEFQVAVQRAVLCSVPSDRVAPAGSPGVPWLWDSISDLHTWIRGGDATHDNVSLLWTMLTAVGPKLDALKADLDAPKAAPVVVDKTAADLIAASLLGNPQFQQVVSTAAQAVITAMDADLAKRFGPQGS